MENMENCSWQTSELMPIGGTGVKKSPMKLEITPKDGGYQIKLDETVIHHVEHYSIDQASAPGKAILTLKVLVEYP